MRTLGRKKERMNVDGEIKIESIRRRTANNHFDFLGKDWNVVVNLGSVSLSHALRDPDNVPALLLLQLQQGIEHAKMKLLHECIDIQTDL